MTWPRPIWPPSSASTGSTTCSLWSTGEFLLYQTGDGRTQVECRFADETLWLTQAGDGELFATTPQNVTQHPAIFAEGELSAEKPVRMTLQVRTEGGRQAQRRVRYYRLEAILAVGFRVRSVRGKFRRWATERLGEYLRRASRRSTTTG